MGGILQGMIAMLFAFVIMLFYGMLNEGSSRRKVYKPTPLEGKTYTLKTNTDGLFLEKIPEGSFCYTFINNTDYDIENIQFYSGKKDEEFLVLKDPLERNGKIDIVSPFGTYWMEFLIYNPKTNTRSKLNSCEYKNKFETKFGQILITNDGILVSDE